MTIEEQALELAQELAKAQAEMERVTDEHIQPIADALKRAKANYLKPLREHIDAVVKQLEKLGTDNPAGQTEGAIENAR